MQLSWSLYEPGKYVACLYDGNWWIGIIREKSEEHGDVLVSFLHPHGPEDMKIYELTDDMTENRHYWKTMVKTGPQRSGDGL